MDDSTRSKVEEIKSWIRSAARRLGRGRTQTNDGADGRVAADAPLVLGALEDVASAYDPEALKRSVEKLEPRPGDLVVMRGAWPMDAVLDMRGVLLSIMAGLPDGDIGIVNLHADQSIEVLDEAEMERIGWVRADRLADLKRAGRRFCLAHVADPGGGPDLVVDQEDLFLMEQTLDDREQKQ